MSCSTNNAQETSSHAGSSGLPRLSDGTIRYAFPLESWRAYWSARINPKQYRNDYDFFTALKVRIKEYAWDAMLRIANSEDDLATVSSQVIGNDDALDADDLKSLKEIAQNGMWARDGFQKGDEETLTVSPYRFMNFDEYHERTTGHKLGEPGYSPEDARPLANYYYGMVYKGVRKLSVSTSSAEKAAGFDLTHLATRDHTLEFTAASWSKSYFLNYFWDRFDLPENPLLAKKAHFMSVRWAIEDNSPVYYDFLSGYPDFSVDFKWVYPDKQPWRLPQQEWEQLGQKFANQHLCRHQYPAFHRQWVEHALTQGWEVPPEVLMGYPDLLYRFGL